MILLDTNMVIAAVSDRPSIVVDKIALHARAGVRLFVSSIVIFELRFGIAKSRRKIENKARLEQFLSGSVGLVPFDADDAAAAGAIRAALEKAGTPIGPYDILIAGQALRHGATLVTANTREFDRVPGLKVEDWGKE